MNATRDMTIWLLLLAAMLMCLTPAGEVAAALGVDAELLRLGDHGPQRVSCGFDQIVEITDKPLGIRTEPKRREILAAGHGLRVYVPFGEDWYGYSSRRLKENPEMAGMIAKAVLFGK